MANCRSCGAIIKFIKTKKGKWMPVDPELLTAEDVELGDVIVTDSGEVTKVTEKTGIALGYISHFATCPNADEHRS
jgi:hypothetical protein